MTFNKALKHILAFEGGYANDPDDRGGETFRGISRKNWPLWPGWALIDDAKKINIKASSIDRYFTAHALMDTHVRDFYYYNFWHPLEAHHFPARITAKVFDASINVGANRAIQFLQLAINKAGFKLKNDGIAGPLTKTALSGALLSLGEELLLNFYVDEQKLFYKKISSRPGQNKFLNGWLRRAESLPL